MPNNKDKKEEKFKAGFFILISLAFLLFGMFWLKHFQLFQSMKIIAKFENPGPLMKGIQVYYRGINIGKITKLRHTKDYKFTLVYLSLFEKDIKIPACSVAEIKQEGMTGQKYIDLTSYGKNTKDILANGDIIKGRSIYSFSDFSYFLQDMSKSGKFKSIFDNFEKAVIGVGDLTTNLEEITSSKNGEQDNLKTTIRESAFFMSDMHKVSKRLGELSEKESFWENVESTAKNMNEASININDISSEIKKEDIVENLNSAIKNTDQASREIRKIICELRRQGVNEDIIASIIHNTDDTILKVNCFSDSMNELMRKRFVLFRLMFGKPGEHFEQCDDICKLKKNGRITKKK